MTKKTDQVNKINNLRIQGRFGISGDDFKALRKRRGLTQTQVGKMIGVERQTMGNWENEVGAPTSGKLFKLLSIYGVSSVHLLVKEINELIEDKQTDSSE